MKIYRCSVVKHKCNNGDCGLNYASGKQGTIVIESHDKLIHADAYTTFVLSIKDENEDIIMNKRFLENFQCESE